MNSSRGLFKTFFNFPVKSSVRGFKKGSKKLIKPEIEVQVEVEQDTKKLATHVCGTNLLIDGKDVEIKPDSEYPDWLWDIYTGPSLPLSKLSPDSIQYWNKVRKYGKERKMYLDSLQRNKSVHK